ncbi:UDP-N-acetylmuramoyl-L-alanyl-D-glutamate--2,6-diaminopimelate ligase [Exilibacterium tricleocarpae]|uniref:UDP-N-acetylmuramoyl-L-alanyl-D-glutamate--2,6-diaminopimelate ligase n=2 Tax=Exilibacterium tricleocarpae TaxID=2591008 RepID=A0A545TQV8_9GAMM|nr:UDP-N-acetylmuramoyl-L-alanyl-D-glutamate--2,6-diaminopimelate ligase [Exilibacterium tricleocarpae]
MGDLLAGVDLPPSVADVVVHVLCIDSRSVGRGDVFVALRGARTDGRDFIPQALAAGAAAVLVEAPDATVDVSFVEAVPVIAVPELSRSLSAMAGHLYGQPSQHMRTTGITGTNGKTTCTHLLAQLETLLGNDGASLGTLGYGLAADAELTDTGLTTPDAVTMQKALAELYQRGARSLAMEVSSHSLVQGRVAGVAIDVGVFTNLTHDHLDYHGDMESYGAAKRLLFTLPGLVHGVINRDDAFGRQLLAAVEGPRLWSYGIGRSNADVQALQPTYSARGIEARVISPWGEGQLRSALLGQFNLSNLLAVITAACVQGASFAEVMSLVPRLKSVVGRMQRVDVDSDIDVIVDYAHTPDALEHALASLRRCTGGPLWCVFGCGGDRDRNKRPLMGAVAERGADQVVITSDNPRGEQPEAIIEDIEQGVAEVDAVISVSDRAAAIAEALARAPAGTCILIAGKGHEEYQQIGDSRLAFSDLGQARLALHQRNNTG